MSNAVLKRRRREMMRNRMQAIAQLTDSSPHDTKRRRCDIIFRTSSIMSPHAGLTGVGFTIRKFRYATHTVMHDAATAWLFSLQNYPRHFVLSDFYNIHSQ